VSYTDGLHILFAHGGVTTVAPVPASVATPIAHISQRPFRVRYEFT
jgi:hypothetical protein